MYNISRINKSNKNKNVEKVENSIDNLKVNSIIIKQVVVEKIAASNYGVLAQLGEHLPYKQRVTGSSPVGPIDLSEYGGIAQLARAHGSYPWCRWFKSSFRYEERGLNFRSLLFFCSKSFG